MKNDYSDVSSHNIKDTIFAALRNLDFPDTLAYRLHVAPMPGITANLQPKQLLTCALSGSDRPGSYNIQTVTGSTNGKAESFTQELLQDYNTVSTNLNIVTASL